ncbi:MAG: trimethylamine methyltransferase family protein, partial [Nitrospinota bacterium]|nr:trimethylamine methyltransferase family protein [Nitrospinota bacterium]
MAPPKLRTLTEAELEQIEAVSFRILEEIGIKFNHRGAIALLKRAGAKVDEENLAARIPRELVRE